MQQHSCLQSSTMEHNQHHLLLLFLLLLAASSAALSAAATHRCHPEDRKVLFQIKKALGNPYLLASWTPDTDCCDWYLVECDETTNRIIKLLVMDGEINGPIPPEVGNLPYLQELYFRKLSNLTGPIPASLARLQRLRFVSLSWTNLSGPVPAFFSKIKTLEYLDLSFNDLSGTIPPELAALPNLGALHLDRNRLTGPIPASYGSFASGSTDLYLSHNQLTGDIPLTIANLNFRVIDLSRNRLTGSALFLFNKSKPSQVITISRNLLEFDFSKAKFPKDLISLDISHNKIYGQLPKAITGVDLQQLNVSYNRLCGKIPVGGRMQDKDYTTFFHNRCLCGKPLDVACKSGKAAELVA